MLRKETCLIFLIAWIAGADGSHFRGAIIMWKPADVQNKVEVTYRIAWRRSYSSSLYCDDHTIQTRQERYESRSELQCLVGCSDSFDYMRFYCTDYSVQEDWTAGQYSTLISFPHTASQVFLFGRNAGALCPKCCSKRYKGTAWIDLRNGGGDWHLVAKADLNIRSDKGKVNSSPTSTISPIIRVIQNCNRSIAIPVSDEDGDVVRCRWAKESISYFSTADDDECGGVCQRMVGATLNESTCIIHLSATGRTGTYAIAIQIEDFINQSSYTALSSVPAQFLVVVSSSSESCDTKPKFTYPTPHDHSCIGIPLNETYSDVIIAEDRLPGKNILEIKTTSPEGLLKSDLGQYNNSSDMWYVNITYAPTRDQRGQQHFCFAALDIDSIESDRRCIQLNVGVLPPTVVNGTQMPHGNTRPFQDASFSVEFDQMIYRPASTAYIYIYEVNGTMLQKLNAATDINVCFIRHTLTFDTTFTVQEKKRYYVLLDRGVAVGNFYQNCRVESQPVLNPTSWQMRIRDVTPPVLTEIVYPNVSKGDVNITWNFSEAVTTRCALQFPNGSTSAVFCNNSWKANNLSEGYYYFSIVGTDMEDNVGKLKQLIWKIDRTPPTADFFINVPNKVTNETSVTIFFECDEKCYAKSTLKSSSPDKSSISCSTSISAPVDYSVANWIRVHCQNLKANTSYILESLVTDEAGNQRIATTNAFFTDFDHPNIYVKDYHSSCGQSISPNATGYPNVTDNYNISLVSYDDKAWEGECAIRRTWSATDLAGNVYTKPQKIYISAGTTSNFTLHGLPRAVFIACGDLQYATERFIANNITVDHPCNLPCKINYSDPKNARYCDTSFTRAWIATDPCGGTVTTIMVINVLPQQPPKFPKDGQTNIDLDYPLQWPDYPGAVRFKIYLWQYNTERPASPYSSTYRKYYRPNPHLTPGKKYNWQVEYVLKNNEVIPSQRWAFQTRTFSDLIIREIVTPPTAYSGESFDVKWTVKNIGQAVTDSYFWTDAVYVGFTNITQARMAARQSETNILLPNDTYTSRATVHLGQAEFGSLYVFVYVNIGNSFYELNKTNNKQRSRKLVDVLLIPPPDLQVSSIVVPRHTVSDGLEIITWTVINNGYGVTEEESWTDFVYLSSDTKYDGDDIFLASHHRIGILEPSEKYRVTMTVKIPRDISGEFFILVWVDRHNSVFEHLNYRNNVGYSENVTVALRPPPDLSISSLTATADVSTGDVLSIFWTVTNTGQRAPYVMYWTDTVHISSDYSGWSIGSRRFLGNLDPTSSYSSEVEYLIPSTIASGKYNITVTVDYYHNVFENGQMENNVQSKEIYVQRKLPDLHLTLNFITLVQIDGENCLNMSWSVKNIGNGPVQKWIWTDRVEIFNSEISMWPIFEENVYIEGHHNTEYTKTEVVRLPRRVYGNVTVTILADVFRYTSEENRDNNKKFTVITVPLVAVDFVLINAKIPQKSYASGDTVTIFLTLKNNGNRNNGHWYNDVYLSYSPFPTKNVLTRIVQTQRNILKQGQIYTWKTSFIIPNNVVGRAFIHCNVSSSISEIVRERSRDKHVIPITIKPPLSPDLVIDFVQPLTEKHLYKGDTLNLFWTVHNRGNSMDKEMKWQDVIIMWQSPLVNYTIGHFPITLQLESNGAYIMSKAAILSNVTQGNYNVCIITDAYNTVQEFNNEENNVVCSARIITVVEEKSAVLKIFTKMNVSYDIFPGAVVPFSFTVINIGQAATESTSWNDMVYLSEVPLKEISSHTGSNRMLLKQISHIGQLYPLESYTVNVTLRIPIVWKFESAYLSVVHDSFISEYLSSNFVQEATVLQTSFSAVFSDDLYPEVSDTYIDTTGGQPFHVIYNVTYIGESQSAERFDTVILSDDVELDPFDRRLKTTQEDGISANSTSHCNTTVFIPYDLETKNYFIIVMVDVSNAIYEYNENNNQAMIPLTIKESLSTDLVVHSIDAPKHAAYHEDIDIKWKIRNNGTKVATGYKCDSVFFSLDDNLDVFDQKLGNPICSTVSIQPYTIAHTDMQFSVKSVVPVIAEQNYTVIVKTRSNIPDVEEWNNVAASGHVISVTVEKVDLEIYKILSMGKTKKKPLKIPDVPSGETMIISTRSMNNSFYHSIKVRSGRPATDYDFDIATENPLLPNQIISVSDTDFGDYYLLIEYTGQENDLSDSSFIEIYAKVAKFEITGSSPRHAAPLGNVTLKIEGSLFNEIDTVELHGASRLLYAVDIYRFTSTLMYATFDITGLNISDSFSLYARSRFYTNSAVLSNALTIISGSEGRIISRITLPSSLAQGERTTMYVDLENIGDTDVLVPLLSVVAKGVGRLKLITDTDDYDYQAHYMILGTPSHGLGGIYQPRQVSRLIFDVRPTNMVGPVNIEVRILHPKNDVSHFYVPLKTRLKYSHYDDISWNGIWKQFMENVDTLIDMSDKRTVEEYLFQHIDFQSSVIDSNVKIDIERKYSTRLGFRHSMGSFGKGWISTLWDTKLKDISPELAQVTVDKKDYYMFSYQTGKYKSKNLGTLHFINNDTIVLMKEENDLVYTFSILNGSLTSIRSSLDGSWLNLIYNDRQQLITITSSSGSYVDVLYDAENRVVYMDINNDQNNAEHSIVYHYDAAGCLDAVYSPSGRILYRYNEDNAPILISYEDGKEDRLVYDVNGYIKSISKYYGDTLDNTVSYAYDGATSITKSIESHLHVTYTFDENRDLVSRKRKGFLIQKWNRQPNSETIYEDDMVIYKRTFNIKKKKVHIEDASGDGLTVFFNEGGQMISMLDGNANRYELRRNQAGVVMEIIFPDNSTAQYNYSDGHIAIRNHAGGKVKYETDDNGRVILDDISDNNPILYTYGESGELQSARNNLGKISLTHNSEKRPIKVSYRRSNGDSRIAYEMDDKNLCTGIMASDGYGVQYVYNYHKKLTKVVDRNSSTVLLKVQYDKMGRLSKKILGNNATVMYKYDNVTAMLVSMTNTFPNGSIASKFDYTYNFRLRIVTMETTEGKWKFRYDNAGQLAYIERPDGHRSTYSYDRSKNRKFIEVNGQRKRYLVNSMNQYKSLDDTQFMYDKNGNLVGKNGKTNSQFVFEIRNILTGLNISNVSCSFKYDALGNIHSKRCGNKTTTFFINPYGQFGQDILSEYDESSQETTQYFYGANQLGLLAMKRRGKFYYYQFDPLGSTKTVLDENGDAVNTYQYDPFGGLIFSTEKVRNPYKFVGQWGVFHIEATEIYFMRARFYDCDLGRFLSLDPNGLSGQSKNFYAYAFNNPIEFKDPKGNFPLSIFLGPEGMLMSGAISVLEDTAIKLLTGQTLTLGGAAGAFVSGAIAGPLGNVKYGKVIVKLGAKLISASAGSITQNLIDKHKLGISLSPVGIMGSLASDSCPAPKLLKILCDIGVGIGSAAINLNLHNGNFRNMMKNLENDAIHGLTEAADKADIFASAIIAKLYKDMKRLDLRLLIWLSYLSMDPNNLIGPPGYGAAKFIRKDQHLDYTIQFENEANATGPAQRVYIEQRLDQNLEPMTLQIKKFGFGSREFALQEYKTFVYMLIDLTNNGSLYLRVHGGLNDDKNVFTMEFKTIDPLTGDVPTDPRIGFLPPNNGTSGQGYITISIKPKAETATLSRISAKSTVFFDNNLPIFTPEVTNTVDDSCPEVNVTVIEELLISGILAVSLQAFDLGSGFKEVDIYIKQDSMFKILLSSVKDKTAILPLEESYSYEIVAIPVDNVGNRNDSVLTEQTTQSSFTIFYLTMNYSCPKINNCSGNGKCVGPNICACNKGHFGSDCSSTLKPLDSPIVEVTVEGHTQGHPAILRITLEFPSGTPDSFYTTLVGMPNDAQVHNGLRISPGVVLLPGNIPDYLLIRMPTTYYGQFALNVTAFAQYGKRIASRSAHIELVFNKEEVNINLEAVPSCYRKHIACANNSFELKFNISQDTINITDVIEVAIPKACQLNVGQFITFGLYSIDVYQDCVIPNLKVICRNAELTTFIVGVTFGSGLLGNFSLHTEAIIEDCKDEPVCPEVPTTSSTEQISQMQTTKSQYYDDSTTGFTSQTSNIGTTHKKKETIFNVQLELSYNISKSLNFTDTSADWYKQLHGEISVTLTNIYQTVEGFVRVDILSLRHGSLIVDHNVITVEELSTSSDMSATIQNIIQDKVSLKLENKSVAVQSIKVKDTKGNAHKITRDELIDGCQVLQAIAPCGTSSQCIIKNDKPICAIQVKVAPETKTNLQPLKITIATLACVLLLLIVGIGFACVRTRKKRRKTIQQGRLPKESSSRHDNIAYEGISAKSIEDHSEPEETNYDFSLRRKAGGISDDYNVNPRYVFENKTYKTSNESLRDDMDHEYRAEYASSLRRGDKCDMGNNQEDYPYAYINKNLKIKIPRPSMRSNPRQHKERIYDDDDEEID